MQVVRGLEGLPTAACGSSSSDCRAPAGAQVVEPASGSALRPAPRDAHLHPGQAVVPRCIGLSNSGGSERLRQAKDDCHAAAAGPGARRRGSRWANRSAALRQHSGGAAAARSASGAAGHGQLRQQDTCGAGRRHTTLSRSGAAARPAATSMARTSRGQRAVEIEVRAYRRVILAAALPLQLSVRGGTAAAHGEPAPPRAIPKRHRACIIGMQ